MNNSEFRRLALALPEAIESAHMNHPDFRVGGKIFATLSPSGDHGVVMLASQEQAQFVREDPAGFSPVPGGWGARGATRVHLDAVTKERLQRALGIAWRRKAPKQLSSAF